MEMARRKCIRLPAPAYESGWYFVTVCTEKREAILAETSVGADDSVRPCGVSRPSTLHLTPIGLIVRECLEGLENEADGIHVDKYVVMPNHIHAILHLKGDVGGQSRPPLPRVMQGFKSITTRRCWALGRKTLWQRSFYDHVIRDENDYLRIWQYIEENPLKWTEDIYFKENTP